MAIYSYKNYLPKLADDCYIAPGVQIIGRIELNSKVSVWHNCVLRGDVNDIIIGQNTNIQDLSMLHVTEEKSLIIGENVTIGHSVTLHACDIGDNSLIGMGAIVLDGAVIPPYSIVAAGSVVAPGKIFPTKSMIMGSPARVTRELRDNEIDMLNNHYKSYLRYAADFKNKEIIKKL